MLVTGDRVSVALRLSGIGRPASSVPAAPAENSNPASIARLNHLLCAVRRLIIAQVRKVRPGAALKFRDGQLRYCASDPEKNPVGLP